MLFAWELVCGRVGRGVKGWWEVWASVKLRQQLERLDEGDLATGDRATQLI